MAFDADDSVDFTTPSADAASFAIGPFVKTEWVSAKTPWLALDRDGSGCIESQDELFGPPTGGANGFDKLALLDANHDGRIDARDPLFASLLLWTDANQDRQCTSSEIRRLADTSIVSLDLAYTTLPQLRFGSHEGEEASLTLSSGKRGRLIDVYLSQVR